MSDSLSKVANCGNLAKSYLAVTLAYYSFPLPLIKPILTFTYLYKKMYEDLIYFRREKFFEVVKLRFKKNFYKSYTENSRCCELMYSAAMLFLEVNVSQLSSPSTWY